MTMGMQATLALFDAAPLAQAVELASAVAKPLTMREKVAVAVRAIKAQVLASRHLSIAWSGGKDSSVTLTIALMAMRELIA